MSELRSGGAHGGRLRKKRRGIERGTTSAVYIKLLEDSKSRGKRTTNAPMTQVSRQKKSAKDGRKTEVTPPSKKRSRDSPKNDDTTLRKKQELRTWIDRMIRRWYLTQSTY